MRCVSFDTPAAMKLKVFVRVVLLVCFLGVILANAAPVPLPARPPIINGEVVQAADPLAQSTVAIIIRDAQSRFYCSGSLISEHQVLTAAHCVADPYLEGTVIFQRENVFSKQIDPTFMRKVLRHDLGNGFPGGHVSAMNEFNDLAIIEFEGGLPPGYKPIPIVSPEKFSELVITGSQVTVAGYGMVKPNTVPDGVLRKANATLVRVTTQRYNFWTDFVACGGDSGGPAVIEIQGQLILVGVFSRTDCRSISIFSRFTGDIHNGRQQSK